MKDIKPKSSAETSGSAVSSTQTTNKAQPSSKIKKSNSALKIILIILAILFILGVGSTVLIVLFAKTLFQKGLESATKGNVKVSDTGVTVKDKSGDTISSEAKLPEGFPSDVPSYNGAKITFSAKSGDTYFATFSSSDGTKKAFDAYKAALTSNGWSAGEGSSESFYGDTYSLTLTKGNRKVNAVITPEGNGASISVTIGPKE